MGEIVSHHYCCRCKIPLLPLNNQCNYYNINLRFWTLSGSVSPKIAHKLKFLPSKAEECQKSCGVYNFHIYLGIWYNSW